MDVERQSRLYRALAEKYKLENVNQSWLCYENAMFIVKRNQTMDRKKGFARNVEQKWNFWKCSLVFRWRGQQL